MGTTVQEAPLYRYPAIRGILRLPSVLVACGKKRSTHYNDVKAGLFTPPVSLGSRAVGWPADEVAAINAARIAGYSEDDLRALVRKLTAERAKAAPK